MLAVTSYSQEHVAACRAEMAAQVAAFRALGAAADHRFLAMLVLALDHMFMHRLRSAEGKDGNALNEVRMLSNGIIAGGTLTRDSTMKYDAKRSLTGIRIGDPIALEIHAFERLVDRFLAEIERRYPTG